MIKDDPKIRALIYGDLVEQLAAHRKIDIDEAREIVAGSTFNEYRKMVEDVTPPSGQTIGPTGPSNTTGTSQAASGPTQVPGTGIKSIWPGKGAPVEQGMTVGLKGPNGVPVPGQISQVDLGAKGVKVKNPTTGQEEWTNMDALEPFQAGTAPAATAQPGNQAVPANSSTITTTTEDAQQLTRLRELAGIKENCSAGATGAGAIAVAPAAMGGIKKRQMTDEELKKEYVPKEAAKTIVGDTKPNQASGELSSNLAVRGKKTASRANNGFKR